MHTSDLLWNGPFNRAIFFNSDILSGNKIRMEKTGPGFGDFEVGSHSVEYVARDAGGNKAVCNIVIEIQGW